MQIVKTVKTLPAPFQREMYPILLNFARANAANLTFPQLSIASEAMGVCASAYSSVDPSAAVSKMIEILHPCLEILFDANVAGRVGEYLRGLNSDFSRDDVANQEEEEERTSSSVMNWEERGFLMDVIHFTPDVVRSYYCALWVLFFLLFFHF